MYESFRRAGGQEAGNTRAAVRTGREAPAPSPTPRPRRAIFTIVSCNYIAYAATLMQSVRTHHPDVARFIILADTYRTFPSFDFAAELVFCEDVDIPLLANMALWYTVI